MNYERAEFAAPDRASLLPRVPVANSGHVVSVSGVRGLGL